MFNNTTIIRMVIMLFSLPIPQSKLSLPSILAITTKATITAYIELYDEKNNEWTFYPCNHHQSYYYPPCCYSLPTLLVSSWRFFYQCFK
ncbi:MAG: hypothetical protein ACTSYN_03255 [Candidatus Heimdallarchaeaceae archaeon]